MAATLFSPITLGPQEFPNRIVVAPMCQYSARDGDADNWHLVHLGTLSVSGAGLVMVEATAAEERGRITHGCLGLYNDGNEAALAKVVAGVRDVADVKLGIQIAHSGRKGSSHVPWEGGRALSHDQGAWPTIAPSPLPFTDGWPEPRAIGEDEFEDLAGAFAGATRRAARIGFDVIEMHAAHGYLLHQFLSPLSNRRDDRFGGSLENRMRLPLRVFEAMREACPPEVTLGARITGSDWLEGGITPEEAAAFAAALKALGCDYVDVSSGGLDPSARVKAEPGYQVGFAAHVRAHAGLPVRAVGLVTDPAQAEAIVASGRADMVALARAMLADPRWPWRAAHALGHELAWPAQYRRATPASWFDGAA